MKILVTGATGKVGSRLAKRPPRCSQPWGRSRLTAQTLRERPFDTLLDGRRIREDLGFKPQFPRLADALAAGA